MARSKTLLSALIPVLFIVLLKTTSYAQITTVDDTTATPIPGAGHDYIHLLTETVNPASGSISLRINIPVPKARGITLPFSFGYDSNSVNHIVGSVPSPGYAEWESNTGYLSQGGWSFSIPTISYANYTTQAGNYPNYYSCNNYTSYMFSDPSGGQHALGLASQYSAGQVGPCAQSGFSTPNGGDAKVRALLPTTQPDPNYNPNATYSAPITVFTADGTVYNFPRPTHEASSTSSQFFGLPSTVEDRNGNILTFSDNGGGSFSVEDTSGRSVISSNGFGPSGSTNTLTIGGLTYQVAWTTTTANFGAPLQNPATTNENNLSDECNSGVPAGSTTQTVISQITLPNGQSYQFFYGTNNGNTAFQNPYGLLNKIVYPDGGWVQYSWSAPVMNELAIYPGSYEVACGDDAYCVAPVTNGCLYQYAAPVVSQRQVGFTSLTGVPSLTQSFTYATSWTTTSPAITWTSKTTTVQTTDNVRNESQTTTYSYSPITVPWNDPLNSNGIAPQIPVEQTTVYKDFNGALLKTVNKTWNNQYQLASEQTQWPNGHSSTTSQTTYAYTPQFSLETAKNEWDYATSLPSTPTRMTATTYQSFTNTPGQLADRACSVVTCSGGSSCTSSSSNKVSETDYLYDGSTGTVCGAPGPATTKQVTGLVAGTHDESNFSYSSTTPRGNVTQKIQWLNIGTSPTTTYTYDETGQILTVQDPCGAQTCSDVSGTNHTTTYSYADSYSSGTPNGATDTYLTKVTYPTTAAGVTLTKSYTYSYTYGQLTSATDTNGNVTYYKYGTEPSGCSYQDELDRLTEVDYPDGGVTTNCYNDNSAMVTTTKLINQSTSTNLVMTTMMDGLGHVVETQVNSDPDGADFVSTVYDGFARVFTRSNPERSTPSTTDGTTTYTYDGLGRTTIVKQPDNSLISTSYAVGCTSNTAEPSTTVTDEAGHQRITCSDALGRLVEVDEPGTGATAGGVGSGTVTIGGTEQTIPATSASGTVAISNGAGCTSNGYTYIPSTGSTSVSVQGILTQLSWGGNCNSSGVYTPNQPLSDWTSNFAASITGSGAGVSASSNASGTSITVTANTSGTGQDYALIYGYQQTDGSGGIAAGGPSSLSGGTNAIYDSGSVSITVGSFVATTNYSSGSTPSIIASGLSVLLNGSNSPVSAQLNGNTITLTANVGGTASNYALSGSTSWNTQEFTNPSFNVTLSGSDLTGGANGSLGTTPLVTLYSYDMLNDLVGVQQEGGASSSSWRNRSFTYDSLARLLCAANPEIQLVTCPSSATGTFPFGAVTYTYDANGNLATRAMPMAGATTGTSVTTHNYTYDNLNRMIEHSHVDPSAGTDRYGYDGSPLTGCPGPDVPTITSAANLLGNRTGMCTGQSASGFSYDPVGRMVTEAEANKGSSSTTYVVGYSYWKDGSLNTLTYPSGDVLTYLVGGAGRPTQVTDSSNNFVTGATYTPSGALVSMTNSTSIETSNAYNDRQQPILLSAFEGTSYIYRLCYDFHLEVSVSTTPCSFGAYTTGDNGNVFQVIDKVDSTRSRTFEYDLLNRITQANTVTTRGTNCWGETYSIDAWGNLTNIGPVSSISGCYYESLNAAPASVQNQLSVNTYDLAGNVIQDNLGNLPTYDAENRIATVQGYTYYYDADDVRMEKTNGSSGTMYWLGPDGPLTEASLSGTIDEEYVFFNGERIARVDRPSGTVHYYFSDFLHSASVITDPSGDIQEQYYYYPFGNLQSTSGSGDPNNYKFTGKERDSESNLDNFGARYYSSSIGRFMIPDWAARPTAVPYAVFGDPQSLNLYTYVRNDPVSRADADGHCSSNPSANDDSCRPNGSNQIGISDQQQSQKTEKKSWWASLTGVLAAGVARISPAAARKLWEAANPGQKVPFDAVRGRFYDMDHIKALADGGTNAAENLTPREHGDHVARHVENGDFARWASRAEDAVVDTAKAAEKEVESDVRQSANEIVHDVKEAATEVVENPGEAVEDAATAIVETVESGEIPPR